MDRSASREDVKPADEHVVLPAKPFEFTDSRYADAAMSPFFHNFCDDIKLAQLHDPSLLEDDDYSPRPLTSPIKLSISRRTPWPEMNPPFRLECQYDDCNCDLYRPSLYIPSSLASDEDWDELYSILSQLLLGGVSRRQVTTLASEGRYLIIGHDLSDLEHSNKEVLASVFKFLREYRQVKVLLVAAAEKARREDDPFNPDNWKDDANEQVGEATLSCICGHQDTWHLNERLDNMRRWRKEEEEEKKGRERAERNRLLSEQIAASPYWEYPSKQDIRTSETAEELGVEIRIENGQLVVPEK